MSRGKMVAAAASCVAAATGFFATTVFGHTADAITYTCSGLKVQLDGFPAGQNVIQVKVYKGADKVVGAPFTVLFDAGGNGVLSVPIDLTGDNAVQTELDWTADGGGSKVYVDHLIVSCSTSTVTVTTPGPTTTVEHTVTLPGTVLTVPGPTVTVEKVVPGPTVTVAGPATTVTVAGPTQFLPGPVKTITLPGKTKVVTKTVVVPKVRYRTIFKVRWRTKVVNHTRTVVRVKKVYIPVFVKKVNPRNPG